MLLNEVFQLGNATTLQGERGDIENQLHFNLTFATLESSSLKSGACEPSLPPISLEKLSR